MFLVESDFMESVLDSSLLELQAARLAIAASINNFFIKVFVLVTRIEFKKKALK